MAWYRSVGIEFLPKDMYLWDPHQVIYTQEDSTSNPQKNYQAGYSQPLTQQDYRPINRHAYDFNMSNTQQQYQEHILYHRQQEDHYQDTQYQYTPKTSPYHNHYSQNTQLSFNTNYLSYYSQETQTS